MENASAKDLIYLGDFETAKKKYENANFRWKNHWWETCVKIYNTFTEWAQKYTLDLIHRTISAIKRKRGRPPKNDGKIIWNCPEFIDGNNEKFYLIELLDKNGDLIWSKIGTTKNKIIYRMRQHLSYYKKYGVEKIWINRVYNVGFAAEGMESEFRAKYIHRWPDSFKKNDRFYHKIFDLAEADEIASAYCG